MRTSVHPIEVESYAILRSRVDLADLPPLTRAVIERVVHTTADPSWAGELVCDEPALAAGRAALLAGAPLITDVRMVAAGITAHPTAVAEPGSTRAAAGIRAAVQQHPDGAVWVIGNAPTALFALVEAAAAGDLLSTPLVVGLPVGFVGAMASKADLRASGLPAVTNRGERGGAAAAAAVVNALLYAEEPEKDLYARGGRGEPAGPGGVGRAGEPTEPASAHESGRPGAVGGR